MLKRYTRVP